MPEKNKKKTVRLEESPPETKEFNGRWLTNCRLAYSKYHLLIWECVLLIIFTIILRVISKYAQSLSAKKKNSETGENS